MHFGAFFAKFSPGNARAGPFRALIHRLARVNEAATPRRILLRSGTRRVGAAIFMISKLRLQIARPA
jgi:hypothetical protein